MSFQPNQRIRTTNAPLSPSLRNQRGVIVERYRNPISNWTGPVEYLVHLDNGQEYLIAEHFIRVEYLDHTARSVDADPRDACGICGGDWSAAMRGEPECQGHTWTSLTFLERQRDAHYGRPCDLGRVALHTAECPVCRGIWAEE